MTTHSLSSIRIPIASKSGIMRIVSWLPKTPYTGPFRFSRSRAPGKGLVERSKCLPPIVAGEDAEVVFQARKEVDNARHRLLAHVRMQIAQMQDPEAIESLWDKVRDNFILPQPKLGGVPPPLPV